MCGRSRRWIVQATIAMTVFTGLLAMGVGLAAAQTMSDVPHPAHVHKGSCGQLNPNSAFALDDVKVPLKSDEKTPSSSDIKGALNAVPVETSEKSIDISLDDLLKNPYAINITESSANIGKAIACGNIGGIVVDDNLLIGLQQQNDSGYVGVAVLHRDGDQTKVTLYVAKGLAGPSATPGQATPVASGA